MVAGLADLTSLAISVGGGGEGGGGGDGRIDDPKHMAILGLWLLYCLVTVRRKSVVNN